MPNVQDTMSRSVSRLNAWAFRLLCAAVFSVAFSLPLGRLMVVLCLVTLVVDCVKHRRYPAFPLVAWCWLLFFLVAVMTSVLGVDPPRSVGKLDKLLWFLAIPLSATLVQNRERARMVLGSLAVGAGVLALEIVVWRPFSAWRIVRDAAASGEVSDFVWEVTDQGSMTDGQTLMLAIVALVGIVVSRWGRRRPSVSRIVVEGGLFALLVSGLIVNLKRGSWICTIAVVGLFALARLKVRYVVLLGVVVVGTLFLPFVRGRVCDLRQELDASRGGRIVMWTKIAPALVKAHPFGIGYRALTADMMQDVALAEGVHVEPQRDHVHSNPLQILIATGWIGLAVFVVWMGVGLINGIQNVFCASRGSPDSTLALSMVLMLGGLLLNGLVEYNFGDGELVVLYAVILGILSARWSSVASTSESSGG